jgi:hypothetical protein
MPTYQANAWCSFPHYTTFEVDARSPKEALRKARQQVSEEYPEPCNDGVLEWDEFEICPNCDDAKSRTYFEPSRRAEMAAQYLLRAAEFTLPLLEVLACSSENRQERRAYYKLRAAINKATKP